MTVLEERVRRDQAIRDLAGKYYLRTPSGDFIIDMINKILSMGANAEIYLDADNKRIRIGGATAEILLDGANKRILVTDGSYNRILLDGVTGALKISKSGYNVLTATAAQMLFDSAGLILAFGNLGYALHQGERQWTTNATWTNIKNSTFQVDGDSFVFTSVYLEILGCVEQAGRTAYYRIYNVTDASALANSEITTTATSTEAEDWINAAIIRSAALTFPSGEKTYRLQFRQNATGGVGDSTQFFKGLLFYAQ